MMSLKGRHFIGWKNLFRLISGTKEYQYTVNFLCGMIVLLVACMTALVFYILLMAMLV